MNAVIISIGDELVLGQTIDTNSAWLSQQLSAIGIRVLSHITVADDQASIAQTIRETAGKTSLVLISGGLGPTADDLTRHALADVLDVPLEHSTLAQQQIEAYFKRLHRPMPPTNNIQAMIPRGADMIENTNGTAPGIRASINDPQLGRRTVYVMPGVPREMKTMFQRSVLPELIRQAGGAVILSRTLHTFGMGESAVAERLGSLMDRNRNPSVGTTVSNNIVSLRLNAHFESRQRAERELAETEAACRNALGDLIFGEDDQTLAGALAELLKEHPIAKRWAPAVVTVESCTGGLVAKYLTDVPGSSAYFRQGWVTYHNEAKLNLVNVKQDTLERFGAVSEAVVCEMALGGGRLAGAAYALAISGIAGPDGGSADKPVGTVCIALASPEGDRPASKVAARTFHFAGDRETIRDRAAKMALAMLRYELLGKPMPF